MDRIQQTHVVYHELHNMDMDVNCLSPASFTSPVSFSLQPLFPLL